MAPATVAGASTRRTAKGQGRRGGWDRENVISAIQEWVATYGEPPRAADWNPSSAKWSGQRWRVERYRAGRADGSAWPALNSAKRPFGGSLNAAIRAAGFEPAKPGPTRRADVDPEQADRAMISPEGHAMVRAALAQAREAEKRVAVLEARLARRGERERVVVTDDAAIARAQRAAAAAEAKADVAISGARERTTAAKAEATDARRTARRLAARLERAEATIAALRAERRELRTANATLADRLTTTERELASARADALAAEGEAKAAHAAMRDAARAMRDSARAAEAKARTTVKAKAGGVATANGAPDDGADALVALAQAEATAARRGAREAEARAIALARDLAALRGEPRALTAAERARLQTDGPSGPAVLAASLKGLARARDRSRSGHDTSRTALAAALLEVASAAVNWRERL